MPIEPAEDRGLPRRDFLKVGLGFSLALTVGTAVVGCSDAAKTPSAGYLFLRPGDVELFSALAPAVVTELGGPMSHAAVVAREFGFPCVVDVQGATRSLPQGALVEVDGATGEIRLLEP